MTSNNKPLLVGQLTVTPTLGRTRTARLREAHEGDVTWGGGLDQRALGAGRQANAGGKVYRSKTILRRKWRVVGRVAAGWGLLAALNQGWEVGSSHSKAREQILTTKVGKRHQEGRILPITPCLQAALGHLVATLGSRRLAGLLL